MPWYFPGDCSTSHDRWGKIPRLVNADWLSLDFGESWEGGRVWMANERTMVPALVGWVSLGWRVKRRCWGLEGGAFHDIHTRHGNIGSTDPTIWFLDITVYVGPVITLDGYRWPRNVCFWQQLWHRSRISIQQWYQGRVRLFHQVRWMLRIFIGLGSFALGVPTHEVRVFRVHDCRRWGVRISLWGYICKFSSIREAARSRCDIIVITTRGFPFPLYAARLSEGGRVSIVLTDTPISTICQSVDRLANRALFTVRLTEPPISHRLSLARPIHQYCWIVQPNHQ